MSPAVFVRPSKYIPKTQRCECGHVASVHRTVWAQGTAIRLAECEAWNYRRSEGCSCPEFRSKEFPEL